MLEKEDITIKRPHSFPVRLSDSEFDFLNEKYRLSGYTSRAKFIRDLIKKGYVLEVDMTDFNEYNTHLSQINRSLNQMAKRVNATGSIYAEDIKEIKEDMNRIWQSLRSILSKFQ